MDDFCQQASRRLRVGGLVVWVVLAVCGTVHAEGEVLYLPVHFHLTRAAEGQLVADQAFLEAQLAAANRIFAPYRVAFVQSGVAPTVGSPRLDSRSDRDSFASRVLPGVINCFVVAALRDVDDPSRMRRGVHWHARGAGGIHYVILSAISEPGVLAHELGHFLGNRPHSQTRGNLMSYDWAGQTPVLNAPQQRRMQRRIREYLRTGELKVGAPP